MSSALAAFDLLAAEPVPPPDLRFTPPTLTRDLKLSAKISSVQLIGERAMLPTQLSASKILKAHNLH